MQTDPMAFDSWRFEKDLSWQNPLELARRLQVAGEDFLLFYSGMRTAYSGNRSFLLWDFAETVEGDDPAVLYPKLMTDQPWYSQLWAGYLGYGLKNTLEPRLHRDRVDELASPASTLPDMRMVRPRAILCFDHAAGRMDFYAGGAAQVPDALPIATGEPDAIVDITSPMSKSEYLRHIEHVVRDIHAGELYQANITRKFVGEFAKQPDALALFTRLAQASPGTYSAYLHWQDVQVVSSSPERFLTLSREGFMESRPIKGTARRLEEAEADAAVRSALEQSIKDRAENLMIVDLMRNDLARSCVAGSVGVQQLFHVQSYQTVHHMASTIYGKRREDVSPLEAVMRCFPPGSMTGAPKMHAMQLCSELERLKRGIYSGAIGWFGGDGSADLSVVIRTIILRGTRFEFQVGGGIVADSEPLAEWQETMTKARGMAAALGITMDELEAL